MTSDPDLLLSITSARECKAPRLSFLSFLTVKEKPTPQEEESYLLGFLQQAGLQLTDQPAPQTLGLRYAPPYTWLSLLVIKHNNSV